MGTGVPLLNEYKLEFFAKRLPQTILGGLKLRIGYDAPFYVYINQVVLFVVPFILGGIFTLLVELDTIKDYIAVYTFGALMAAFVLLVQLISHIVQASQTADLPVMRKKKNLLAEEDEVDFISCCDVETVKFIVPPKKYKLNVLIHALVAGPMCGLGLWYLLPTTLNNLYSTNTGATVVLFILGWFTLLVAQYPLATAAPPETAAYRTTDILELSALMRSFYVYIFIMFDLLHRMDIYWSRIKNLPGKVYWPVQVVGENEGKKKINVYCKSDNAIISVAKEHLIKFPGPLEKFRKLGIEILKRKKLYQTLETFKKDLEWATEAAKGQSTAHSNEQSAEEAIASQTTAHCNEQSTVEAIHCNEQSTVEAIASQTTAQGCKPTASGQSTAHCNEQSTVEAIASQTTAHCNEQSAEEAIASQTTAHCNEQSAEEAIASQTTAHCNEQSTVEAIASQSTAHCNEQSTVEAIASKSTAHCNEQSTVEAIHCNEQSAVEAIASQSTAHCNEQSAEEAIASQSTAHCNEQSTVEAIHCNEQSTVEAIHCNEQSTVEAIHCNEQSTVEAIASQSTAHCNEQSTVEAIASQTTAHCNEQSTVEAIASQSTAHCNEQSTVEAIHCNEQSTVEAIASQSTAHCNEQSTVEAIASQSKAHCNEQSTVEAIASQSTAHCNEQSTVEAIASQSTAHCNEQSTVEAIASQSTAHCNEQSTVEAIASQSTAHCNEQSTVEAIASQSTAHCNEQSTVEAIASQSTAHCNEQSAVEAIASQSTAHCNEQSTVEAKHCNEQSTVEAIASQSTAHCNEQSAEEAIASQSTAHCNEQSTVEAIHCNEQSTVEAIASQTTAHFNEQSTVEAIASQTTAHFNEQSTVEAIASQTTAHFNEQSTVEAIASQTTAHFNEQSTVEAIASQTTAHFNEQSTVEAIGTQSTAHCNEQSTVEAIASQTTAHFNEQSTVEAIASQTTAHGYKPTASACVATDVRDSEENLSNEDMDWDSDDSRKDPDYQQKMDQTDSESDKEEYVQDSDGENSDISETWPALVQQSVVRSTHKNDTVSSLVTSTTDIEGNEIVCDKNYPEIFVRKVIFSDTYNNKKKKTERVQNSRHACIFCGKLKAHIQDHFLRKHRDRTEVQAIMNCEIEKQTEKKTMLRAEGDHLHNMKVIENKAGELILFRRPDQTFDHKDYGPCISCKVWLLKSSLVKHLKTCSGDTKSIVRKKRYLGTMSDIAKGAVPEHAQDMLTREVFTIMTLDEVGIVAREDELICQLGEVWLKTCIDNKKKRAYWSSQHMRLIAKLLLSLRNMLKDSGLTMWNVLRPSLFPSLVKAALEVSLPGMDDIEELKSPTNVIKLKYDLIRLVQMKSSKACQMYDRTKDMIWETGKKEAEDVLLDINRWWKTNCTKLARKVLLERKLTKKEQLPDPRDIQKLGEFLSRELHDAEIDRETVTYHHYKELMELAQARLLSYNKRRSGEIEDITLRHYGHKLDIADLDEGLMGEISDTDKYLMKTHELIQTRGKRGGIVPVLIPQECTPVLNFIADAEVREKLHITSSYLFGSVTDGKPIRAYDSLKNVCERSGIQKPENITSTNLRKYMATLAQVMNLSADEMQQMCRHLGHTTRVHLAHYRTMSPFIERVTLGKILLMQDLNIQAQYSGQPLKDINFIDLVCETSAENTRENHDDLMAVPSGSSIVDEAVVDETELRELGESEVEEDVQEQNKKKGKGKFTKQRWTVQEMDEIKQYFSKQLEKKQAPRQKDCIKAKQASKAAGGQLHRRAWHLIVKKVYQSDSFLLTNQVLHVIFVFLPLFWTGGVLAPIDSFLLYALEQAHVFLFGGSFMASDVRLLVMVVLSTSVYLGAYYIKVSLGTIILCALAGYLLSIDLGGLGSQLLSLITRNRVSASRTDVREPDKQETGRKFLWKWGLFEFLYHFVMLAVVGVIAGLLNKNSTEFSSDSWKIVGYCIIGVCVLEKLVRDLQGVFILFGLWRNKLFPSTVRSQRVFHYRKLWLTPLGIMRRGLVNWVGPLLMLSYLSITITSRDPTSVSLRNHLDLATGVWYVFGTVRAFRWIWQSTVHALLELSVVHIVMVTMDTNTTVIKWGIPILAMLASLCRDRLYQLCNKLYFFITLLISSWSDKKQRRESTIPIIVVSLLLFPLIFGVISIAAALSVPLLPLFTLPLVFFSFPRHLRSWPEDVGGSANSCPDTNFYRQLAPELSKAFASGFANGSIGEASPGNHYLVRFQDRLVWVMVLERGASYCTINIKGLELQETSCHTVEAARIDDIFESAFEIPEGSCAIGQPNEYPLHCLTPLDAYCLNAYSDARNVLTGIIDSPSSTEETMKAFLKSLVWVLLKYVNKMKMKQSKGKKSAKFDKELSFIAQKEKHELKEINTNNNINNRPPPQKSTVLQPLVPEFERETRSPTPPPVSKDKQKKMASSWGSLDSFTDSIFSDDGIVSKKKPSKPPAALKPLPTRNKSPEIEDLFEELDIGLPAYDVTKPKPPPQKFGGAKSFGNAIYKPQTNLAGSPDFKSPYSSQLSLPKEWRELPLDNSQVSRLMNKFPVEWYKFVLKTLDWSCEDQSKEKVLQDVMGDDALRNCYAQLTMACYSIFEGQGYSGPSLLYKCYMGEVSINAMWDWLGEHTDLQNLVKKAFRYGFKLMIDQMLLGEMTSDQEWQEALEEYDNDWYIGLEKDPEWTSAILASKPNMFSMGHNNTQNTYNSRTLTIQTMDVSIGRLNPEVVRGQWANLALELLYMTNDDEERYSIQAHPVILRNLTVQAADPPLGYPIYSSKPISVPLL